MAILYKNILEAFQPAKEISDPHRFSGRKNQIEHGAELLLTKAHTFIHGVRGIGKSSLARQLELIAAGNVELLRSIESPLADESFDFVTCFLTRDSSIQDINHLLYRLLIDKQGGLAQWEELLGLPEIGAYEFGAKLNTKLVSDFWERVDKCASLAEDGIAIFVDEFELIENHDGFASLVKAAPANCIFVVTGIGQTEKDLVRDHKSLERQLDTGKLEVPNMSEEELRLIIKNAENYISNEIIFDPGVVNRLVEIVQGHPYLLHLVGKHALMLAFKNKETVISERLLGDALQQIASGRADRVLEDRYLKAIGNSSQREIVLRIFAASDQNILHTSVAYREAEGVGVSNPSYWVADLQKEAFGGELEKVAEQNYKVKDPLFKAYVAATPSRLVAEAALQSTEANKKTNELSIVHVSDIHFGPKHYFSSLAISSDGVPDADKPELAKYLVESLRIAPDGAGDILLVTGDVTQTALTEEFESATECLKKIAEALNDGVQNSGKNVVVVPGNHDVNWAIQQADPSARYLGFVPYTRFRTSLGFRIENQVEPERLYEIHDFIDRWNCVIVGFNSAVIEGPDDHRGYIGESQLRNALLEVAGICGDKKPVKIAMFHHHLASVSSLETNLKVSDDILRDAAFIKSELVQNGFSLVLHGHRHFAHEELVDPLGDGGNKLVVVGCGSTGVCISERDSQPLQYNRVSVRQVVDKGAVAITIRKYFFEPTRRNWLPSEDHKPKTFTVPLPG